tara:strand:- start:1083 stop:1787 length:705 start_codon:yes stop_codon:yes gene_type:complete
MNEKEYGALKFGKWICLLIGLFGFIAFFLTIFLPDSLRHVMLTPTYFTDYEQYKWLFQLTNISFIIFEIFSVGLIAFFYMLVRPKNFAIVFFTSLLGAYGSFLGAIYYLKLTIYVDRLYVATLNANEEVIHFLMMMGLPNYDQRLFIIGLPAIWWLVLSTLSLDNKFIPRVLVVLGFLIGFTLVAYLVVFYQHNLELLKWIFIFKAFLITIWSGLEYRFISQVIKDNNGGVIHH